MRHATYDMHLGRVLEGYLPLPLPHREDAASSPPSPSSYDLLPRASHGPPSCRPPAWRLDAARACSRSRGRRGGSSSGWVSSFLPSPRPSHSQLPRHPECRHGETSPTEEHPPSPSHEPSRQSPQAAFPPAGLPHGFHSSSPDQLELPGAP